MRQEQQWELAQGSVQSAPANPCEILRFSGARVHEVDEAQSHPIGIDLDPSVTLA